MGVRFESGEYLTRSANFPPIGAVSMCCWAKYATSPSGWRVALAFGDTNDGAPTLSVGNHNPGGVNRFGVFDGTVDSAFAISPTSGQEFFVGFTSNGTNLIGYARLASGVALSSASLTSPTGGVNAIRVGTSVFDGTDYFDGTIWNVKCWDRALSAAEMLVESYYRRVMFPASINFYYPLDNHNNTNDLSGNARNPTVTGTLSTVDGSHGLWLPRRRIFLPAGAATNDISAAGLLSISGSADLDATGTLAAAGAVSISGAADLDAAGSLVAAGAVSITGAADLDAVGQLLAAGALSISGTGDLDAIGNVTAAGALAITGTADLDAIGQLAATGSVSITGAADLDAIGTLAAAGALAIVGAATITGASANDMSAAGVLSIVGTAALKATAALVAAGSLAISGAANLTDANAAEEVAPSLIMLSDPNDPFVALDDAGRVLPFATLDFYESGTTIPATLDDGYHYVADADGEFDDEIPVEADVAYRVIHKTAAGVLRWDVDPWLCTCGEQDPVFRSPVNRAADDDGRALAGATLTFLDTSDDPATVYADPDLSVPLPNPLTANAAGFFSPIYYDDSTELHITLRDADGAEVADYDPYECECGVLHETITQVFTASQSWTVPAGIASVDVFLVGGGGGGGFGDKGGGGGGGRVRYVTGHVVTPEASIAVVVGAGGTGSTGSPTFGGDGGLSSFGALESGGGAGGGSSGSGPNGDGRSGSSTGGSGGGGGGYTNASTGGVGGSSVNGFGGGNGSANLVNDATTRARIAGGGGGGQGAVGQSAVYAVNAGAGGVGVDYSSVFGSGVGAAGWFAGGGGGGSNGVLAIAAGGTGGGGNGAHTSPNSAAVAGTANTGGGGGGGGSFSTNSGRGGNGGSGVVIVRYVT